MVKEREDELYNMDNQKRMERVQDKFPHDDLQLRDLDAQVGTSKINLSCKVILSWACLPTAKVHKATGPQFIMSHPKDIL